MNEPQSQRNFKYFDEDGAVSSGPLVLADCSSAWSNNYNAISLLK